MHSIGQQQLQEVVSLEDLLPVIDSTVIASYVELHHARVESSQLTCEFGTDYPITSLPCYIRCCHIRTNFTPFTITLSLQLPDYFEEGMATAGDAHGSPGALDTGASGL